MKISNILIEEGFSRSDFFDMYLLLYASTEPTNRDDQDIQRFAKFYVDFILNDLIKQLTNICISRLGSTTRALLSDRWYYKGLSQDEVAVSKKDIAEFLKNVIDTRSYKAVDRVWQHIYAELLDAVNATTHREKIIAVDRLMNMLHHGGEIIDYLDQSNWLSHALNYRDNASPIQLARFASSKVREAVGMVGGERGDISPLKLLSTAIRRAASEYPNTIVSVEGDTIRIECSGVLLQDSGEFGYGPDSTWFYAGGSKHKLADRLGRDANAIKVANTNSYIIGVRTRKHGLDRITFTDKFRSVKTVDIPIQNYYQLARYLIQWLVSVAESNETQTPEGFWD
jgi:hypothetical protein